MHPEHWQIQSEDTLRERELLGVVFALKRFASLHIWEVYHSWNWPSALHKHMEEDYSNFKSKTTWTVLRLEQYNVDIDYLRGKENIIADILLRVAPLKPELQECDTSLNKIEKIPVHHITQIAPASPERLQEMWGHIHRSSVEVVSKDSLSRMAKDNQRLSLQYSVILVLQGWNHIQDSILYKGVRLIIPQSERASTLKVLHIGHYAMDKINLRARETVYWPGISEDIKVTYHRCDICAKFARTQQKEILHSVKNTSIRMRTTWFRHFLIEKYALSSNSLHSMSVIKCLIEIFTEIGVPICIVSDSGTWFTSQS